MRKITTNEALKQAYDNLYNSPLNKIDKNLKVLIKAKKYLATHKNTKHKL